MFIPGKILTFSKPRADVPRNGANILLAGAEITSTAATVLFATGQGLLLCGDVFGWVVAHISFSSWSLGS